MKLFYKKVKISCSQLRVLTLFINHLIISHHHCAVVPATLRAMIMRRSVRDKVLAAIRIHHEISRSKSAWTLSAWTLGVSN